ncbi:MAG TPA: RHS repeat-associated core domain-containing protein [Terriglobales bacterium]|nr:RHS repeat-associated core domain-containing protein [Terriglobales bacterium]
MSSPVPHPAAQRRHQQTCTYGYDDMRRITSVNCGTPWAQTFSFDPFGNISKSGSISFLPTYSTATNRMTALPGFTPVYDSNGNLTSDSLHTYAWDSDNHPTTIDSVTATYDALGRMVEQNKSGTYYQIVYGPTGGKLAMMNGQAVQKQFVPLPAGAAAVYASSGLSYYRHPDWLGSSRLASTPSRGVYFDGAYAPFGEPYSQTGTTDLSFTGQNQDTVTGLYDFMFREYHPTQGRWISPDPAGLAAVDPSNPQSLNRYAYALNNPLKYIDRDGRRFTLACSQGTEDYDCAGGVVVDENGDAVTVGDDELESNEYDATVGPNGVQFTDPQGNTFTGIFVNGTDPVHIEGTGNLLGFNFTFTNTNLEGNQTAAGYFTFSGTPEQAAAALQSAGFAYRPAESVSSWTGARNPLGYGWNGYDVYRGSGQGAWGTNSGHFNLLPLGGENVMGILQSYGNMHFGETSPYGLGVLKHISEQGWFQRWFRRR